MARARKPRATRELPPPLPPAERNIGQLIAEAIRLYGRRFLRAVPLGVAVAGVNQLAVDAGRVETGLVLLAAAPVFTLCFAYASQLATGAGASIRSWLTALAVGIVVWVPAALLFPWFALAGVVWLALFGLAVPAAIVEGSSFLGSLRRGFALGRVDIVHSAGALAALVVLFVLTRFALALVLESQADNTVRTAVFLADVVLAPLLFLGGGLLYGDQAARLGSAGDRPKERDADVPHAHDADREGSSDPPRESRSAT